jgi:hypothetical protein
MPSKANQLSEPASVSSTRRFCGLLRQYQIACDALTHKLRTDRRIVGITVHDNCGLLHRSWLAALSSAVSSAAPRTSVSILRATWKLTTRAYRYFIKTSGLLVPT